MGLAQAQDRIPEPGFLHGEVCNLWKDAAHAHGLWRRTGLEDYQRPASHWQTVLDLDALSAAEQASTNALEYTYFSRQLGLP